MSQHTAIRIEGGLFAPDLFDQLLTAELPGQRPADFQLNNRRNLTDEIAALFSDARVMWTVFQHQLERLSENDKNDKMATSTTRASWMVPFFRLLGYEIVYNPRAYNVDGLTFKISHRAGEPEDSPPVHIVGIRQELGRVAPSGRPRLSPHALVQEFLNRTEAVWGLVTNGRFIRLLRDSTYIRRQSYVEFDLRAIFEQGLFEDFALLYRLLHRTRLPGTSDPSKSLLEQYYQYSIEQGGRVRDHLRDGVEDAIKTLANGFLSHRENTDLRRRLSPDYQGSDRIDAASFYEQLLRLIYRFLFLFVSEARGLISSNPLYMGHYSVSRLQRLVDHPQSYTEHDDIYRSLRVLWYLLSSDRPVQQLEGRPLASLLGLPVLNGNLFRHIMLDDCLIQNRDLLTAIKSLTRYRENASSQVRRVNYAALDVEELGSVYESLLDFHPRVTPGHFPRFDLVSGSQRKSTGSYYTPTQLVTQLIKSALEPVIRDRLARASTDQEKKAALLSIKVVDPAAGSGHFLLAAARVLGKELARVSTQEQEPAPEQTREAIRDVVSHCIYGVDKNPLAVELCRVALWLESHTTGKPLTFLDHHIKCGDALVGLTDLNVLDKGIPDGAFTPVTGDDKKIAASLKKENKGQRTGEQRLFAVNQSLPSQYLALQARKLEQIPDDSPEMIRNKQQLYNRLLKDGDKLRRAANIWTATFFEPRHEVSKRELMLSSDVLHRYRNTGELDGRILGQVDALAAKHRFFHWPLEFPAVFQQGGFDVVLGNPPWERIKLQEKEFFDGLDPDIANAPNASARKRMIRGLAETKPDLWQAYQHALHTAESLSRFLRASGLYPFTGRGDINTYSVFAERMRNLVRPNGRAGMIVPTGIATDDTNKAFFADLIKNGHLVSLYDFENREKVFPAVDSRYKFSLMTLNRPGDPEQPAEFAFFLTRTEQIRDQGRVFTLSSHEIRRINPNTMTVPIFRTTQDAALTRAIYERVPVLKNEKTGEDPWGIRFFTIFHMSNDSGLFHTKQELTDRGFEQKGNRFVKGSQRFLPLYEAKMIHHFDHRFGTFEHVDARQNTHLPTPGPEQHADPAFVAESWYYVEESEVKKRLGKRESPWMIGFRDITNTTNERTAIFSLLPWVGAGHNMPLIFAEGQDPVRVAAWLSNFISLVFDFTVRQKVGGTSLGFFILKQLPILPPDTYSPDDLAFIVPRVVELTYTAWDVKPFADDLWQDADHRVRQAILDLWQENGGHDWQLPDWIDAYPEIETDPSKGIPVAPFQWDESRRARLRADLDAYFARLYHLNRKQLRYILDPHDLTPGELKDILDPHEEVGDPLDGYEQRAGASEFFGQTFAALKKNEERAFGEYRTRRLVLEAWEGLR